MYIQCAQEISPKTIIPYVIKANEQELSEVKTTVDLSRLDLRSWDQNIIQKIQWVKWAGEIQGYVTLADGATLFFDDTITCADAVCQMQIGDQIQIYQEGSSYFASGGRLADYSLSADKDDYTILDRYTGIKSP